MPYFSNRLKELRTGNALTQKELAAKLNVSQNAIFNWENGKREPSIDMLKQIADFFGVSLDYLTGNVIHNTPHTIAAHFDGDEYTKEEIEEIRRFAEFVKNKRNPEK